MEQQANCLRRVEAAQALLSEALSELEELRSLPQYNYPQNGSASQGSNQQQMDVAEVVRLIARAAGLMFLVKNICQ